MFEVWMELKEFDVWMDTILNYIKTRSTVRITIIGYSIPWLSVKAGMRNWEIEWGEWWECAESEWECG